MNSETRNVLLWLTLFGVAMGFFETSIVVYLREIYYPGGFSFPLVPIDNEIGITEVTREVMSMVMIISVAVISFKSFYRRFASFLFIFAIWDIFYYVFLKLILNWPDSFMTWDILYLIPVAWTGPVIAPVLISVLMILLALVILYGNEKKEEKFSINLKTWGFLIGGAFVVFIAFIWDYLTFLGNKAQFADLLKNTKMSQQMITQYIPDFFNWYLFIFGYVLIIMSIYFIYRKNLVSPDDEKTT